MLRKLKADKKAVAEASFLPWVVGTLIILFILIIFIVFTAVVYAGAGFKNPKIYVQTSKEVDLVSVKILVNYFELDSISDCIPSDLKLDKEVEIQLPGVGRIEQCGYQTPGQDTGPTTGQEED